MRVWGEDMNKEWEARLIYLSPGSRRRVRLVAQNLAALVPWNLAGKWSRVPGVVSAPNDSTRYVSAGPKKTLRTPRSVVRLQDLRLIRNPTDGTLIRERRLQRAPLKIVKSDR